MLPYAAFHLGLHCLPKYKPGIQNSKILRHFWCQFKPNVRIPMSGKSTLNIYSTNFWAYEPKEAVRVVLFCSLINQRVQPFSYQSEGATFLLSIRGCNLSLILF